MDVVTRRSPIDQKKFERFYVRNVGRSVSYCWTYDPGMNAEDVVHDVLVEAFARENFDPDHEAALGYMMRAVRWRVLQIWRGNRGLHEALAEQHLLRPDPGESGEDAAVLGDQQAILSEILAGLSEADREIWALTRQQELDGRAIARQTGYSVDVVYQRRHRMYERLDRSIGALLVAKHGRGECRALARLLRRWDGQFSETLRKRVSRHVKGTGKQPPCVTCKASEHRLRAEYGLKALGW